MRTKNKKRLFLTILTVALLVTGLLLAGCSDKKDKPEVKKAAVVTTSEKLPKLVDFWSPTCPPCRAMMPFLNELATEYDHAFELVKIDDLIDLTAPGVEQFKARPKKELKFEVDDERYSTTELELTPVQILSIAELKSEEYYLKQIVGHQEISYKDKETELISMLHNPRFFSCKKGPATVSFRR